MESQVGPVTSPAELPWAVHRLNVRLGWLYALSLLITAIGLAGFDHYEHARATDTYVRTVRAALATGNIRRAYQILRPALHDRFTRLTLVDPHRRTLFAIDGRGGGIAWRSVTIRRPIPINPRVPATGQLASVSFTYEIGLPILVLAVASALLLLVFRVFHRVSKRSLELHARVGTERRLAEQLAHDIRSPLSAMSLTLGGLGELSAPERALLATAARRIGEIADDLLAPARIGGDVTDLVRVAVESVAEVRAAHADRRRIWWVTDLDPNLTALCRGNAREIGRVIVNLLNNAVEAIDDRGTITLSLHARGDGFELGVHDDGRGIAEHLLPRLGAERVSYGKLRAVGAGGLGLTHAFATARACGGSIQFTSEPGAGTTAKLALPGIQSLASAE